MHGANIAVKEADEKKNGSGKGSAGKKSGPPTGSGGTSKVRPFAEKDEEENRSYMGYFPAFYHKNNCFFLCRNLYQIILVNRPGRLRVAVLIVTYVLPSTFVLFGLLYFVVGLSL